MRSKQRRDGGASLVEFALIMPVLFMLLLGMITGGFALNEKQQMTHATREGARYGAAVAPDQAFASGTWAENVQDLIIERSTGSLDSSDMLCVSLVTGTADDTSGDHPLRVYDNDADYSTKAGPAPCVADQNYPATDDDPGLRVQVTASKPATIQLGLFGAHDVTLSSKATAKSEDRP